MKYLFFDLDHTLWDYVKNSREALREGYDEIGLKSLGVDSLAEFIKAYEYANDYYWIAGIEGSEIYRFNLNGEIDTILPVPVEKPTKIVFGGNDLQSIYVTSIGKGFHNIKNLNGFTLEISNKKYKGFRTKKFDY